MLSMNLNAVNWRECQGPARVNVHVPPEMTGLTDSIEGTLDISREGYVYNMSSKSVLWFKFLGLAAYLSISGTIFKCKHLAYNLFKKPIEEKEVRDLKHIFHLATIAGDAVVGKERKNLRERVEEFALAEIDYNNSSRSDEMNKSRSARFNTGAYVAKCMQPLFHKDQAEAPTRLADIIRILKDEKVLFQNELNDRPNRNFVSSFLNFAPENSLSVEELQSCISALEKEIQKKEKMLALAERCNKYAALSILQQQGCLTRALKETIVETQTEVECCDIMCYRQQKICGLLYRIDCCAMRCWAVDCGCCACCFWPANKSVYVFS